MRLLDPKLDIVFKLLLMRHQTLLAEMLSAMLGESISELEVLSPSIPADVGSDKTSVLDILVALEDGRRVDVEMQIRVTDELATRLVYYGAKEHIKRGQSYKDVPPTIVVAWLAQPLFPELEQLHSVLALAHPGLGTQRSQRGGERPRDSTLVHQSLAFASIRLVHCEVWAANGQSVAVTASLTRRPRLSSHRFQQRHRLRHCRRPLTVGGVRFRSKP